jgi:hypothetical protein
LKRKGKISCTVRGEELKFRLDKPVVLPAFNEELLPSAAVAPKLDNLQLIVSKSTFKADPQGDKRSRMLQIDFKMDNKTDREYSFANIVIVSDHNQTYPPYAMLDTFKQRTRRVLPNSSESGSLSFDVDAGRRKYWLVLLDHGNHEELTRVPVN